MGVVNRLAQVVLSSLSDESFSKLQYFRAQGRWPDLEDPCTFNEQIQWLKVFYRDPLLQKCADKFTVRSFVRDAIGEEYLVPLAGCYENAEEINFDVLPRRFVLKASHGSAWNILCREKNQLDYRETRDKLRRWLRADFSRVGREWAYRGLKPRIVCEEFLSTDEGEPPFDYKFFCFAGTPRYVQVDHARFLSHTRSLYDADWKRLPCRLEYALEEKDIDPPDNFDEMLDVAARLSKPFPLVRVDLYSLTGRVFFGELTFYPGKGIERFTPREFDEVFGQWLRVKDGKLAAA